MPHLFKRATKIAGQRKTKESPYALIFSRRLWTLNAVVSTEMWELYAEQYRGLKRIGVMLRE